MRAHEVSDSVPSTTTPAGPKRSNVEVIFVTKDEQANLPYSLPAVTSWADRVWVVDCGSSDRTCEIAKAHGCEVRTQAWLGHAAQKNWCLDNLPLQAGWVLFVDGDEEILPELRDEMMELAAKPPDEVTEAGFYINRYFIFLNKRIRHCGYYPSWNLRFFKRGKARYELREVHEHMVVDGPSGYLKGHMEHNDRRGLEVYMEKHNRYSTLEAREIFRYETGESKEGLKPKLFGNSLERRRWFKRYVYPRLPAKSFFRFVYMYVWRLGILDGSAGFRFCVFIAAYEMLVGLKLSEFRQDAREKLARAAN